MNLRDNVDSATDDLVKWTELLAEEPDSEYFRAGVIAAGIRVREARANFERGTFVTLARQTRDDHDATNKAALAACN
jgi:hypothetical protein